MALLLRHQILLTPVSKFQCYESTFANHTENLWTVVVLIPLFYQSLMHLNFQGGHLVMSGCVNVTVSFEQHQHISAFARRSYLWSSPAQSQHSCHHLYLFSSIQSGCRNGGCISAKKSFRLWSCNQVQGCNSRIRKLPVSVPAFVVRFAPLCQLQRARHHGSRLRRQTRTYVLHFLQQGPLFLFWCLVSKSHQNRLHPSGVSSEAGLTKHFGPLARKGLHLWQLDDQRCPSRLSLNSVPRKGKSAGKREKEVSGQGKAQRKGKATVF